MLPPGALLGGWAAAYVHGVDALDGHDPLTMAPLPVVILLPPGSRRRSTPALSSRQSARAPRGESLLGIPVTTLWRTVFDLARWAPDVTEVVVAVDAVLAARLVTREVLERNLSSASSRRGVAQVRTAVALSRPGVRSTWESRLRVFATLEVGMVGLQPNRAVFDRSGRLLGIPDLLDAEAGLAIEYDGASWAERSHGHRDRAQHREDNIREERLERAGPIVSAWTRPISPSTGPSWLDGCARPEPTDWPEIGVATAGPWTSRRAGTGYRRDRQGGSDTRTGLATGPDLLLGAEELRTVAG